MWIKISKLQSSTHKAIYNCRLTVAYLCQFLFQATAQLIVLQKKTDILCRFILSHFKQVTLICELEVIYF
jgi:hypothetical protein